MKLRLALKICRELSGDPFSMRPRRTHGQIDQARHIGRKEWKDNRFPYVESSLPVAIQSVVNVTATNKFLAFDHAPCNRLNSDTEMQMSFLVEVGEERWVQKCWCDTMADAEYEFECYAGNGELVRIRRGSEVVKQGGGPQGYSPIYG